MSGRNGKGTTQRRGTRKRVKVRHVKSFVQHVVVIDDGDTLVEQVTQEPVVVGAADWLAYGQMFLDSLRSHEETLNAPAEESPLSAVRA